MIKKKYRYFYVPSIDTIQLIILTTRKDILERLDKFIENLSYGYYVSDFSFEILYDDGTRDYIDKNYDGHEIKRTHIHAMVDYNESENVVFGPFKMHDNGTIETSFNEEISGDVIEIKPEAGEYLRQLLYEEDIFGDTNKEKLIEAGAKISEALKGTNLLSLIIYEGYKDMTIKGISKYY